MSTPETSAIRGDPWQDLPPECRLYPDSPGFHVVVRDALGDVARVVTRPDAGPREAILVDCIESAASIHAARRLYPSHPVIGVLARDDARRNVEILAGGADGVITLAETPDAWRQCLHVVLTGGRWPEGRVGARAPG